MKNPYSTHLFKMMKKTAFFVTLYLLFLHPLLAKKLYKYQDEQGIWHFTDNPPRTNQPVEVRQLKATRKRYIWLQKTGDEQHPQYFIINKYYGPVEVEIKLTEQRNVKTNPVLPKHFIIQPGTSDILFVTSALNKYKSWSYGIQYRYMIGNPQAFHDDQAVYLPPFAKQMKFQISQAFAGKFSHQDEQNHFAVDIVMPEGTPVYSARSGRVIEVNNDFFKGGVKKAYSSRANSIRILHEDGSMAIYAHLALEKAQVYPGMLVQAGQLIAYSGNTGYSSGPHLHFAVQLNKGMKLVSVPFKFYNVNGKAITPQVNTWLEN